MIAKDKNERATTLKAKKNRSFEIVLKIIINDKTSSVH